jgi:Lsr2
MSQKIQTLFIDDIDGGKAEGTVRFGLDGTDYEIDLSAAHSKALRKAAEKYIAAGRKVGGPSRRRGNGGGRKNSGGRPSPSEVREWAKAQGIQVRDRGRVPSELVVKFQAASGRN